MSETQTAVATESITAGAITAPADVLQKPKELLYFGKKVPIGSRLVQIVRVEKFNLIPKNAKTIRDEITIKIGSQWKKGTRDIIRGLTPDEEKRFLPNILGVNANSEKWEERVLNHWADFSIQIPNNDEGILLETGYKTQTLSNGEKEIVPIKIDDYMKYHFCKENGDVAGEHEDNLILFRYRLVDRAKKQAEDEDLFIAKKAIEGTYLSLIKSTDPNERSKIDWILETVGGEYGDGIVITGLSDVQKEMEIEKLKNKNFALFESVIKDEDLKLKALIRKSLSVGKLDLQGETYFLGNKAIGDLKATIGYYKDPAHVKDRQLLEIAIK